MSSSNCCFLICIWVSQEAGQVVWYSHLFQNFPQFIVIHTVKGFGLVNKAEIEVFLKLSCCFDDHCIYYCGQESLQKKGSRNHSQQDSPNCSSWVQSQKWQNDLCLFPRQPFNITVTQVFVLTSNAEEAEFEQFYEDLQDLLELSPKKRCPFHYRGLECKSRKSRNTVNFLMIKLVLEKAEEPEIKLPTSAGSSKKQESSKKTSISALLTMPKPLTVWITINCGKFWERWEYQTTWPASWEICMQVRKQQSELDMEQQTGSK